MNELVINHHVTMADLHLSENGEHVFILFFFILFFNKGSMHSYRHHDL